MAYYQTYPLTGNSERVLEVMRDYFIHNGFELTELTSTGFKVRMPRGVHGLHQQHNPLMMLREVSVESMGQSLTVDAKGGGANKVMVFIIAIVALICGVIALIAIANTHGPKPEPFPWPVVGAPIFIAFLVVAIFGKMHQVAKKLIDVAVSNASMVAEHEARGGRR